MTQPLAQTDFYKTNHYRMYPENTSRIYSNFTPRKSRMSGVNEVVVFGLQYFILEYLIEQWNRNFFGNDMFRTNDYKKAVIANYQRLMDNTLGKGSVTTEHLEKLWDLGYMPLHIKALPEGTLCPIGVPCLTITNTVDHASWLVNYLETILSCTVWQPMTSATIAYEYKKLLTKYALETTGSADFVQFQGHDFSMRGMSSLESACTSGAAHLLSFVGTDTVPAITFLERYYGADIEKTLVGTSVPATEHSVMCMGTKDDEIGTFKRLLDLYPSGILSVVSDTWDLWKVLTEYLPTLKEEILARDGKLVIRPDSGDPVDIICGLEKKEGFVLFEREGQLRLRDNNTSVSKPVTMPEFKGVIELLWDTFGGKINDNGYKELDPHIGAIYGDSITLERADAICERLKAKGFASTNIVFGIGSYTYQYNTRDTFGFAMKATYGELLEDEVAEFSSEEVLTKKVVTREIFKAPITDSGEKKSARGLLNVNYALNHDPKGDEYDTPRLKLFQQVTPYEETKGELQTVFLDGKLVKFQTLSEIRNRLKVQHF